MKSFNLGIWFVTVHIISFLFPAENAAQEPDSLGSAIYKIINKESFSAASYQKASFSDSILIVHYLSEGSRFSSINSDSSIIYIKKALDLSLKAKSLNLTSLALQDMGRYYQSREMYQEAMACFLNCLTIEERGTDLTRIGDIYSDLASVYYYLEVFDKSLDYNQKTLAISNDLHDTLMIARSLMQIGSLHSSREFCEKRTREEKLIDFQTAIGFLEQSVQLYSLAGDLKGVAEGNQNLAAVYNKLDRPDIAIDYIQKSLDYYRRMNNQEGILGNLFTLGKSYYKLKDYNRSIKSFRESEKIAFETNLTGGIQYLYEALAMPYYDTKDYKNAYDCYISYMTIRDSVYNAEKSRQIIELETKYQSELKQKEIMRLTAEKKRKSALVYTLFAVIFLLAFSIYYYVKLLKKNKIISEKDIQIRERKILELEKERLYLAARSVMEGEEAERSRLASDLHNGLGGLLSGIKINLSSMKENSVITHDNVSAFNHAISLLDTSISELRRIAHNLMPETLNHYGLKTALEDFSAQVSPSGKPVIDIKFFGDEIRYSRDVELTMYRVTQEMVNNALKHSEASNINIQVFSEPNRLYVQVLDNGKGFDTSMAWKAGEGKGLENINDRITALNGKLDIWSQPGHGTEISAEIFIS